MKRHTIVGHLGELPKAAAAAPGTDTRVTHVLLAGVDGRLEHRLANILRELNGLWLPPTNSGIDLLLVAALVHAADTRIARKTESQDRWTRELHLVIPVSDPTSWRRVAALLETMLSFLTGDRWQLEFVPRPNGFSIVIGGKKPDVARAFSQVNLFSGGLDSLIGAVDSIEGGANPLFVSHASEGPTSMAQTACFEGIEKHYSNIALSRLRAWLNLPKNLVKGVKSEDTTRGRSFLFIAIAAVAGSGFGGDFVIEVPENGLIALNVPLDLLRLGSLSTRTTHPFYLARWNELLPQIGIRAVVRNSYWNRTKGEMVVQCRNKALLKRLVPKSMSCSSPAKGRYLRHGIEHCGYCFPCLIRQAALKKAWGRAKDPTVYTVDLEAKPLDTLRAKGTQARSVQLAVARLKSKPGIERLLVHKQGSLRDEAGRLDELAAVYRRGMQEVGALLRRVSTAPGG